jgi:hypothetical protein
MKKHAFPFSTVFAAAVAAIVAAACGEQRENPEVAPGDSTLPPAAADSAVLPGTPDSVATPPRDASDAGCGGTTLSGRGVGALRIGMSVDAVRKVCGVLSDTTRLASEGQRARFIGVGFGTETLEAEIVNERVWRIDVRSPRFKTSDGLGVGTPLSRLLSLNSPRGLTGEGQLFVASPDHCGLSFRLSDNGANARSQDWDRAALSRLPSGTVVDRVLAVGCD